MQKDKTGELLPCPFCGGKPYVGKNDVISCDECGACPVFKPDVLENREAWQTRHSSPATIKSDNTQTLINALEENKRLREILEDLYALVRGECPRLLIEDSGGDANLDLQIQQALNIKESN